MYLTGILIGENKADLQGWLKFQREKSSISKNIVGVCIVSEIPIDGEERTIKIE
jgi:hypothetical protein